jgi:uncharacterized membrane protein YfcA
VTWLELLGIALAGGAAGLINTVVGSGTLVTFPLLLAFGLPPVVANVSNTVGLVPGSLSGALATRADLAGQRTRVLRLAAASLVGGVAGAVLLLTLPPAAFATIVPVLIGLGCVLVIVQPWLSRRLAERRADESRPGGRRGPVLLWLGILVIGVYGGYFGAAQGVLLLAVLGLGLAEGLNRANAVKNALALVTNLVSGLVFVLLPITPWADPEARISWPAVLAIAVGSVLGAQVGGRVGRRLPPTVYRVVIVAVGVAAIVVLVG